jgi:hypothetical protein
MYQVPLGGIGFTSNVGSLGTNINASNASINNLSVTSATIGQLKTAIFEPITLNTSVINASQLNLPPDYIIPFLNVSQLIAFTESFVDLSAINVSATRITATSVTAPNVQPTLTAGNNIDICGNVISSTGILPSIGNFTEINTSTINASNLSTADLSIGSNLTLTNKLLNVNSTANVTQNSADLITSGAVYSAFNGTGGGDSRSLTNTQLYLGGDIIKPIVPGTVSTVNVNIPPNTTRNMMKIFYTTKFGANAILNCTASFSYEMAGYNGDSVNARLIYNNGVDNTISQQEQIWVDHAGGGTRSGVLSPRIGNRTSGVSAGTTVYFQVLIDNNSSNDTWTFLFPDSCTFQITETLDNDGGNDLNLNTGDIQADSAIFNSLNIQAGSSAGQAVIGRTQIGNDAYNDRMALSINGNVGATNYGFAQVANNQTIMNAQSTSTYNSFRVENEEIVSINDVGLGIGYPTGDTAFFPLCVNGDAFIENILFADEVDANSVKTNNLSSDNFSTTNATIDNLTITGTITADTFNFSTGNLIPGDNITIVDDVISAFLGSDSIVNINTLHSGGNVDVVGALNVCETSTFGGSLNVSNIIYAGVAGQHEGGLVLYSNVVGNNFTQTYDSSGDEVNITATGSATAINYFVGGTNVLRISTGTVEVLNLEADDINAETLNVVELEAEVFTCIDGKATFRFTTPLLNATTANISTLTLNELDLDELDLSTINASTGNFSVLHSNQLNASTAILTDIGTEEITANYIQSALISATNNITSPQCNIGNISCNNLTATTLVESEEANFSTYNFIVGVGDELDVNTLTATLANINTINVSDANFSSITATDLTLTSSEFPLTIPNGQLNVRQINISRAMLMEGSDSFFGSPLNASNNIGGLPRSRINFWSSTELYTMGMRFGVTEENKAQIKLESLFGNVSVFNINISNISTMDMDNASTTFHNTLNVEDANFSSINSSNVRSNAVNTFSFNLSDQTSSAQSMTMNRNGGVVTIVNDAGSIIFNTSTNSTNRALIMDSNNIIQTRTIQNAGLIESRNISTDENVSVGGSLSVGGSIEGYQETLIAGTNISIVGNTISSAGEPLPTNANFSTVDVDLRLTAERIVANDSLEVGALGEGGGTLVFYGPILSSKVEMELRHPGSDKDFTIKATDIENINFTIDDNEKFNITSTGIYATDANIQTTNTSVLNTSFISCTDEASFGNGVTVSGIVSCDQLDTDEIFTIDTNSTRTNTSSIGAFVYNISDNLDDTEASTLIRNGSLTEFIHTAGRLRFSCNEIQTSGVANFSTLNASNIVGYQETLIAGTNITITGNTISSAGSGGVLPADVNFSSVNTSTLNTSTIDSSGRVDIGDADGQSKGLVLTGTAPTITFKDTNNRSGMIYMNDNNMYFLSGGTNSEAWAQVNGQWPLVLQTNTNLAQFGGNITTVGNITCSGYMKANDKPRMRITRSNFTLPSGTTSILNGGSVGLQSNCTVTSGVFIATIAGIYACSCKLRLPDDNNQAPEIQWYRRAGSGQQSAYEDFEMWIPQGVSGRRAGMSHTIISLGVGDGVLPRNDLQTMGGCVATFDVFMIQ